MHLYSEPKVTQCSRCEKWFMPGRLACAVMHHGDGCCHYGDTEVPAPSGSVDLREDDLRIDVYNCLVPGPDQYSVRILHVPTLTVATSAPQESRGRAREEAMAALREKLAGIAEPAKEA